uniref:Polyketide synthase dehydratase domain-containing protein n=1 Tax=Timema monikensis TaxID=170555 RepID=A0A7R9EEL6_9NEOP|nr:unnamed protein product [Timema monikensis]
MNSDDVTYSEVVISYVRTNNNTSGHIINPRTTASSEPRIKLCPLETAVILKANPMTMRRDASALQLSILIQKASGNFEIMLDSISLVLMGRIVLSENTKTEFNKSVAVSYENTYDLTSNDVYDEMENRGYQYQDQFRGILNAQVGDLGCISTIKWRNNWCSFIDSLIQVVLFNEGESSQDIYLPVDIQQVVIHPSLHAEPQDHSLCSGNLFHAVYVQLARFSLDNNDPSKGVKLNSAPALIKNKSTSKS